MHSTIEVSTLKDPNEQRNTDTTACYLKLIINICPREKGPTAYFKILHRRSDFHHCLKGKIYNINIEFEHYF